MFIRVINALQENKRIFYRKEQRRIDAFLDASQHMSDQVVYVCVLVCAVLVCVVCVCVLCWCV